MPLSSLSKYIILFLFALVVVLGAAIGILSADNRALLKANAALKEQVAYRDMVISEVQNNIDALKAQAAAIEQSCAKRLKARNDVLNIFDVSQREHPPQNFHNASENKKQNKKAIGADARLNGEDNEFFKRFQKLRVIMLLTALTAIGADCSPGRAVIYSTECAVPTAPELLPLDKSRLIGSAENVRVLILNIADMAAYINSLTAPVSVNSFNPLKDNYMEPDLWWVLGASSVVHKTRLIPIVFYSVPDLIKPLYNYLGLPLAFYMKNYVSNADTVRQSISDLCLRFRTKIIKTTAQKIADPQTQARIKYMNATGNNLATLLLAKDEEWIETVTSLTGMDNLLSQMYELMTASTRGIPVTKLLGLSPRGFNATGEYDENNFYDVIDGYSNTVVVPLMEKLAEYILCLKAGRLNEPKYEFNRRKQVRPKDQAEINNLKADCVSKLIMSGVITGKDGIRAIQEDNFKFDWINIEDYKAPDNPEAEMDIFNRFLDGWNETEHDRDKDGKFKGNGGGSTAKRNKSRSNRKTYREMCGTAYNEYSGKPDQAIEHLLKMKTGYVPAAAYKDGIGDIDFLWGEPKSEWTDGYGFAHIIERREEQGLDGISLIKRMPEIIEKGSVDGGSGGRKTITYKDSMIIVEKKDGNHWILTGYILYDKMDEKTRKRALKGK